MSEKPASDIDAIAKIRAVAEEIYPFLEPADEGDQLWRRIWGQLCGAANDLERTLAGVREEKAALLKNEHDLSDSYVTVREIIGAIEDAPGMGMEPPEILWRWVEDKAREVMQAKEAAEQQLAEAQKELATFRPFWEKHALGPKAQPSCLMCGQVKPFSITHAELPGIGICVHCAALREQLAEAQADNNLLRVYLETTREAGESYRDHCAALREQLAERSGHVLVPESLQCIFGCVDESVFGVYYFSKGCICHPETVQALCGQHVITAEPIGSMEPIIEYGRFIKRAERGGEEK